MILGYATSSQTFFAETLDVSVCLHKTSCQLIGTLTAYGNGYVTVPQAKTSICHCETD